MRATLARALRVLKGHDEQLRDEGRLAAATTAARLPARGGAGAACAVLEPLESRRLLSTYYVNTAGSDAAAGTSEATAWKSVGRVNTANLKDGDKVLFAGGQTFSGTLVIGSGETAADGNRITFSTYGSGRATIKSGSKAGFDIVDAAGLNISNINFVGSGGSSNTAPGIHVHVETGGRSLSGISIKNVDVSGYGQEGLRLHVKGGGSSVNNVRVEHSSFHHNLWGGVKMTGPAHNANKNWVIDHCKAYDNYGSRAKSGVTGSGIFIADVDGAMVNRCVAWNNGKDGAAPVGIWAAGSRRVTFQYNEAYNNSTATATDGGGFDFDWDVHNSVMQYNYSHNNAGPGYIIAAGDHGNSGNVVRYNVSESDGRKNGRAGMQLWGNVRDAQIYNNVIYMTATGNSNTAAFYAHDVGAGGKKPYNIQIRNNIFFTAGGLKVINTTSGVANVANGLIFAGNAYHTTGGAFKIQWGATTHTSLSAWRNASAQEKLSGVATGFQGDPKLAAVGQGGTIGNADNLRNLTAYKLQAGSPLINKGVTQPTFLSAVTLDFFGDALPKGGKFDIGIDEVA